jgi:beta-glucanase (GH16 family)
VRVAGTLATLLAGLLLGACAKEEPLRAAREAPRDAPVETTPAGADPAPLWRDEFDAPAGAPPDPASWTAELGGEWGDDELQQYTDRPENARHDGDGHLVITADRERYTGVDGVTRDYTSARLTTYEKFDFRYGKVEARIKVPRGKGLIAGFWGLGADIHEVGWPESGEFDVIEVNGQTPKLAHGSLHGPGVGEHGWGQTGVFRSKEELSHDWHVYAASWTPAGFEFSIDGKVYSRRTPEGLPGGARWTFDDRRFHLLLTLSVGGPWAGAPGADTVWPARMLVDWIRVWRP